MTRTTLIVFGMMGRLLIVLKALGLPYKQKTENLLDSITGCRCRFRLPPQRALGKGETVVRVPPMCSMQDSYSGITPSLYLGHNCSIQLSCSSLGISCQKQNFAAAVMVGNPSMETIGQLGANQAFPVFGYASMHST
jgi:hypothetical protein